MIIYIDLLSGKEVCSDCMSIKVVGNGNWLAVQAKMVVIGGESYNTGANASAEDAAVELEDGKGAKALIKGYFQNYWKALKTKLEKPGNEEQFENFKTNFADISKFVKKKLYGKNVNDLGDWEFYLPEDSDGLGTGLIIPAKWGTEECPVFYFPKVGLKEIK